MLRQNFSLEPPEDTMATDKETLIEVLHSLDHSDDLLWTDDGLPTVKAVQDIAGDTSITRAKINDAAPGFARKVELEGNNGLVGDETGGAPASEIQASTADAFDASLEPEVNGPGESLTEEEVKAILQRRVHDAEAAVEASRTAISEANAAYVRNLKRVDRARADLNRKFPPMDFSDNIQQHIANQQRLLMERVTGGEGKGQLDQAMAVRNRRGWTRPERPVNNIGKVA